MNGTVFISSKVKPGDKICCKILPCYCKNKLPTIACLYKLNIAKYLKNQLEETILVLSNYFYGAKNLCNFVQVFN